MAVSFKPEREFNERFMSMEELGRGRYGAVYRSVERKSKKEFAAKWLLKYGARKTPKEDVEREASILQSLSHPMILQYYDCFETPKEWIVLTELLSGCELFDYIADKEFLVEREAVLYVRSILEAAKYLHHNSVCHLDIKPENVMLVDPNTNKIKLIDFGVARKVESGSQVKVMVGTPEFAAPEVLNYDPVTPAADLWSVGVMTYVLLSGASPFLGDNDGETMQNVLDGEVEFPDDYFSAVSSTAKTFIADLLITDPSNRATAEGALTNPWLLSTKESRIDLRRLRKFKAQRKWKVALRTIRLSLSLCRSVKSLTQASCSISSDCCSSSSPSPKSPSAAAQTFDD